MAVDKMVDSARLDGDLGAVANAIRAKGGTSASLSFPAGFVSAIEDIQVGGENAITNNMGTRYDDLPDLSSLDRTNQVIYYLVDTSKSHEACHARFAVQYNAVTRIERGYIGPSGFVSLESADVANSTPYISYLSNDGPRFWVYKVTSSNAIAGMYRPTGLSAKEASAIPVVAVYANCPDLTYAGTNYYNLLLTDVIGTNTAAFKFGAAIEFGSLTKVKAGGSISQNSTNLFGSIAGQVTEVDISGLTLLNGVTLKGLFYYMSALKKVKTGTQAANSFTDITNMFKGCGRLADLDLSGIDMSNVTTATDAFAAMGSLTNITGWPAIPVSYSLNASTLLTHDSLMLVINALPNVQTAQTLTLGDENKAKLSTAEMAIATGKGWTVA